jgi:hypothetical protein
LAGTAAVDPKASGFWMTTVVIVALQAYVVCSSVLSSNMYDWTSFDTVFEKASKWTYEPNALQTISRNRQNMEGVLFFDRIWGSLGLKHGKKSNGMLIDS